MSLSVFNNFIGVSFCKVNGYWVNLQVLFLQDLLKRVRKKRESNFPQTKQDNNKYFFGTWEKIFFSEYWVIIKLDRYSSAETPVQIAKESFLIICLHGKHISPQRLIMQIINSGVKKAECNEESKTKDCIYQILFNRKVLVLPTQQVKCSHSQPILPYDVQRLLKDDR